jgi:Family of unknown function (DUF5994)
MTTAQVLPSAEIATQDDLPASPKPARIRFRQPVSGSDYIDAAWWPRSRDLTAELPPLLDVLWTAAREITRITYSLAAWDPAPRRLRVEGRMMRLGGFATGSPLTVRLSDAWGRERIDVLVIPPDTDASIAQRALLLASEGENPYRAEEILARASDPAESSPVGCA